MAQFIESTELRNYDIPGIRVYVDDNLDPWFSLEDVGRFMGYQGHLRSLITDLYYDNDYTQLFWTEDEDTGQEEALLMVDKYGLYRLMIFAPNLDKRLLEWTEETLKDLEDELGLLEGL